MSEDKNTKVAADKAEPAAEAKADKATKAPPWQAADYDGPLTGEQADWRHHHIKPAAAKTK